MVSTCCQVGVPARPFACVKIQRSFDDCPAFCPPKTIIRLLKGSYTALAAASGGGWVPAGTSLIHCRPPPCRLAFVNTHRSFVGVQHTSELKPPKIIKRSEIRSYTAVLLIRPGGGFPWGCIRTQVPAANRLAASTCRASAPPIASFQNLYIISIPSRSSDCRGSAVKKSSAARRHHHRRTPGERVRSRIPEPPGPSAPRLV